MGTNSTLTKEKVINLLSLSHRCVNRHSYHFCLFYRILELDESFRLTEVKPGYRKVGLGNDWDLTLT